MPREMLNRWQVAGDEKVTNIPAIQSRWRLYNEGTDVKKWAYTGYNYSDVRVAKGLIQTKRCDPILITYQDNSCKTI